MHEIASVLWRIPSSATTFKTCLKTSVPRRVSACTHECLRLCLYVCFSVALPLSLSLLSLGLGLCECPCVFVFSVMLRCLAGLPQVLVKTIKPYTRIKVPSIAAELNIQEQDVEALLVSLILDRNIVARIDQVNHMLILDTTDDATSKYEALDQWRDKLSALHTTIVDKAFLA